MVNEKLMKAVTVEKLLELGFIEEHDGTGDPRGTDWNIRNKNFHLLIDPWFEVKLSRINPDTDFITLHVTDLSELQSIINWIAD